MIFFLIVTCICFAHRSKHSEDGTSFFSPVLISNAKNTYYLGISGIVCIYDLCSYSFMNWNRSWCIIGNLITFFVHIFSVRLQGIQNLTKGIKWALCACVRIRGGAHYLTCLFCQFCTTCHVICVFILSLFINVWFCIGCLLIITSFSFYCSILWTLMTKWS